MLSSVLYLPPSRLSAAHDPGKNPGLPPSIPVEGEDRLRGRIVSLWGPRTRLPASGQRGLERVSLRLDHSRHKSAAVCAFSFPSSFIQTLNPWGQPRCIFGQPLFFQRSIDRKPETWLLFSLTAIRFFVFDLILPFLGWFLAFVPLLPRQRRSNLYHDVNGFPDFFKFFRSNALNF